MTKSKSDIIGIAEARATLTTLATANAPITFLGRYARPEAVLMGLQTFIARDVPPGVRSTLIAAWSNDLARSALRVLEDPPPSTPVTPTGKPRTTALLLPSRAGEVLSWLWTATPIDAIEITLGLLGRLRREGPTPRTPLNDLLAAINDTWPLADAHHTEFAAAVAAAAQEFPELLEP